MKKGLIGFLILMYSMLVSLPIAARAEEDIKYLVQVDFTGVPEGEKYYATLLCEVHYGGGYTAWDGTEKRARYQEGDPGYEIWKAFAEYEDSDGYFFLQHFQDCTETNRFCEENYLRKNFKILVYFPESNSFFCTEILSRYDEKNHFEIDLSSGAVIHGVSQEDMIKGKLQTTKILIKVVKAIPALLVFVGIAWKVIMKKRRKPMVSKVTKLSIVPDAPRMLGYKVGWLAVKSNSPEAVMEKLEMKNRNVANWETGMENRNGLQYFVTPVMDGYVIVSDVLDIFTENPVKLDEIAKSFEEVLFFGTQRVVELCTWGKYVNGEKIRRYYFVGESGEVVSEGKLTKEELELGFNAFPASEDIDWDAEEIKLPDEESVMKISKAWGVDPFFESHADERSTGYLAEF